MANSDKDIVITPNKSSPTADPKIVFSGADATTAAQNITLKALPTNNGTLSFEGSYGQLFSISNSITGTVFSANDGSGIPSIEILDTGLVKIAQYSGNVLIGTGTDNGTDKLQVNGTVKVLSGTISSNTSSGALVITGGVGIGGALNVGGDLKVTGNISTSGASIGINTDVTIGGNLTVNGTTTTINSSTMTVDDKNLELGAFAIATISTTGTIGTVNGSGTTVSPWTAPITGMTSTVGLIVGAAITATSGTGSLYGGSPTSCIVASITNSTSITFNVVGGSTPTAGTITNIATTGPSDTSANGGGITLKSGTGDKTIIWVSGTGWQLSENLSLASGKSLSLSGTSGTATITTTTTAGTPTLTLPTSTGTFALTSDIKNGGLLLSIGLAAATNNTVTVSTGSGFSANSSTDTTYSLSIGPALSALATTMTGASSGFIKKSSQDTYTLDTNTYLTAEADNLNTVTGRGNTTTNGITVGNVSIYDGNNAATVLYDALTLTTSATTQVSLASYAISAYCSGKYLIQASQGTIRHITEILVMHDGTTAYTTEYGVLRTGISLFTLTTDINTSNVRILVTPTSATSTVFKTSYQLVAA